jgi:polysaccharide biosynthesis/export protein
VVSSGAKSIFKLLAALSLVWGLTAGSSTASEYQITVGDVLELSASSVPEFRYRATVGVDGEVSFPLVGEVQAAQRTLAELRKEVKEIVPRKTVHRRRALDESEYEVVIDADEITLVIAEYSPVYVSGDVAKPGSYMYRPGLTVGKAVSLAGGYDIIRFRTENPHWLAPEVRAQQDALSTELVRDQARIARIQAELGGSTSLVIAPAVSPQSRNIQALEADQLSARLADVEKERAHLNGTVRSLSSRLDLLQKQSQIENEGSKIDLDELNRVKALYSQGNTTFARLIEVRRLQLLSASRTTDIETRGEETRTQLATAQRSLQSLDDNRRIALLKELQDTEVKLASTQANLAAAQEKMFYLGALRSQIGRGNTARADFVIVRRGGTRLERITAREDFDLLPNDLVEVSLDLSGVGSWDGNPVAPNSSAPAPQSFAEPAGDAVPVLGQAQDKTRRDVGDAATRQQPDGAAERRHNK